MPNHWIWGSHGVAFFPCDPWGCRGMRTQQVVDPNIKKSVKSAHGDLIRMSQGCNQQTVAWWAGH